MLKAWMMKSTDQTRVNATRGWIRFREVRSLGAGWPSLVQHPCLDVERFKSKKQTHDEQILACWNPPPLEFLQ